MNNGRLSEQRLANIIGYYQYKAGAIRRPFGKFLARMESRMANKVARRFKAQQRWLIEEMAKLSFFEEAKGVRVLERKTLYDDVDNLLAGFPYQEELVEDIVAVARPTYKKGVSKGIEELDLGRFGVSFDMVNEEAVRYLEDLRSLHLSNFRGSIGRQTKDKIKRILIESAETGRSYSETAKLIQEQGDAGVFSRARGELIAVNQVGHAYGEGNMDIVEAFIKETGSIVQKFWQTVGDDRVTPECQANQEQGGIGMQESWPSGDDNAPRAGNPRCRCVSTFRTVVTNGEPT